MTDFKMVDDQPRNLFSPAFSKPEQEWIKAVEEKMLARGKKQLAFDIDYDNSFVYHFPQSVVYIIEKFNSLGIMQFRGFGRPDSKQIGTGLCLFGTKQVKDLDKMNDLQKAETLFMSTYFPLKKCNTIEDVGCFCSWILKELEKQ